MKLSSATNGEIVCKNIGSEPQILRKGLVIASCSEHDENENEPASSACCNVSIKGMDFDIGSNLMMLRKTRWCGY